MHSLELQPSPLLRGHVQLIWCFELGPGEGLDQPERIAPDGIVELVLHYGTPLAARFQRESFARQPRSCLISQTRRFVEFVPAGRTGFISIRFYPWGACSFLGVPLHAIADRQTDAREVWGLAARDLEDQVAETPGLEARVRLVEQFLLRQLSRNHDPAPAALVRHFWRSPAIRRVSNMCSDLGMTERGLERRLSAAVGMPPRSYLRLLRFLRACRHLRVGHWRSLADVAHECGYYDQAHLTHEFKEYLGMTPGGFVGGERISFLQLD